MSGVRALEELEGVGLVRQFAEGEGGSDGGGVGCVRDGCHFDFEGSLLNGPEAHAMPTGNG